MEDSEKKFFNAESRNIRDVFDSFEYNIPLYQRRYDWNDNLVESLFFTIISNYCLLFKPSKKGDKSSSFPTFLGPLILVKNIDRERCFFIVDGQQRLITISLIILKIQKKISLLLKELPSIKDNISPRNKTNHIVWLEERAESLRNDLFKCSLKKFSDFNTSSYKNHYPRLIKEEDDNITSKDDSRYNSSIAKYIYNMGRYTFEDDNEYDETEIFDTLDEESGNESKKIKESLAVITQTIDFIARGYKNPKGMFADLDYPDKLGYTRNLQLLLDQRKDADQHLSSMPTDNDTVNQIKNLLFFGQYFLKRVVLTCISVEPENENCAYDIFQSLNTTGKPLTAIQTLKPLVARELGPKYQGSPEHLAFGETEKYLASFGNQQHQDESSELVQHFLYYTCGVMAKKTSLSHQRQEIRTNYSKIDSKELRTRYVESLEEIVKYKRAFWNKDREVFETEWNRHLPKNEGLLAEMCLEFIRDTKTSLTIPILARYWTDCKDNDFDMFVDAVKTITSYLVIRRSATGGTAGIDATFKNLVREKSQSNKKLYLFQKNKEERVLPVEDLQSYFMNELRKTLKLTSKDDWVKNAKTKWVSLAKEQNLYKNNVALCRFLLFAAVSNTKTDGKKIKRIVKSKEKDLMKAGIWNDSYYKTVEHIAPQKQNDDWNDEVLYSEDDNMVNRIGNLTLLPPITNTQIGNRSFHIKRDFYKYCYIDDIEERDRVRKNLKRKGVPFEAGELHREKSVVFSPLLEPIANHESWDSASINERSENLLELVWDRIAPWLGFPQ